MDSLKTAARKVRVSAVSRRTGARVKIGRRRAEFLKARQGNVFRRFAAVHSSPTRPPGRARRDLSASSGASSSDAGLFVKRAARPTPGVSDSDPRVDGGIIYKHISRLITSESGH